ncbi:hypothetical protein ARMSODRAFT_1085714 [Armillaria solidipes]|uniref:F-box domain-containing protein n=1 Tax=Armillaria solidipes TaxID=1076256 RepID=A0A2H3BYJ6_9AGAR|nr:hypothetical protein ARMSODRAFT_1085714 [Armillaria solidipes]
MSLLALPAELLEKIVTCVSPFYGTSCHPAIRLTCRTLCDVATPFVFERFYIDLTKMEKEKSHAIHFLKELSQGRQLGRFIRALYFRTSSGGHKSNLSGFWDVLKNGETFFETISKLILAAVPQMQALKEFHWQKPSRAEMCSKIIGQIIDSLSKSPHLSFVSISAYVIKKDIPCAPFHGLTHLTIDGNGTLDYAPAIIANSPNLFRLKVIIYRSDRPSQFPVLSLFGKFPEGTYSSVQQVILSGNYFSMETSTVPSLIPHLRNLSDFRIPVGFNVPDAFWNALLDANVFLRSVTSSRLELQDSFLNYLRCYDRLEEVHLRLGRRSSYDVQDGHAQFFLRNIIPINSLSLTVVVVKPAYAGYWCFDVPMLEALLLCANLVYIGISVDGERARVEYCNNVITKLLKNLHRWHHLETLDIGAVIPIDIRFRAPIPANKSPMREICASIMCCVSDFQCRRPTRQMLKLQIHIDFAFSLHLRESVSKSKIYHFCRLRLSEEAKRAMKMMKDHEEAERISNLTILNIF